MLCSWENEICFSKNTNQFKKKSRCNLYCLTPGLYIHKYENLKLTDRVEGKSKLSRGEKRKKIPFKPKLKLL